MKRRKFLTLSTLSLSALFIGCQESIYSENEQFLNVSILETIKNKYGDTETKQVQLNGNDSPLTYLTKVNNLNENLLYLFRDKNNPKNLFIPQNTLDEVMPDKYEIEVLAMNEFTKNLPIFRV